MSDLEWVAIKDKMPEYDERVVLIKTGRPPEIARRVKWHSNGGVNGECWLSDCLYKNGGPYEVSEEMTHWLAIPPLEVDEA